MGHLFAVSSGLRLTLLASIFHSLLVVHLIFVNSNRTVEQQSVTVEQSAKPYANQLQSQLET